MCIIIIMWKIVIMCVCVMCVVIIKWPMKSNEMANNEND
jgi:hypothetical protein